ncbi:MAG: GTP 3',8-cyclase MoaA [Steroidobacteraceae bacterium]
MTQHEVIVPLNRLGEPRDTRGRALHDLRISVMDRCNFRCPYCMPRETFHDGYRFLRSNERLDFAEITRLARVFARLGVRKLRITGGEPLLRPGLADLIGDLSTIDGIDDVALTTNGVLLAKHATELKAAGLQRVTVSLDSLDPDVFANMSGGFAVLDDVLGGIEAASRAGLAPIKVNCVVQRGVNDGSILSLLEHFRGSGIIVRFIEYMDVGNRNDWQRARVVPVREMLEKIRARWPVRALRRNYPGEVASRYEFADGKGEFGFISSISQPFCGDCTRARLSSEGRFFTCLFATTGRDLRALLRSGATDAELHDQIAAFWSRREDRYSELRGRTALDQPKVEMFYIGG